MKKLFNNLSTVRTFFFSRFDVIILALCFTAIGALIVHLGYVGQHYNQMKEAGKQFPVLPSDYQIVIQEYEADNL